jgi:hypothetical protein
MGSLLRHRTILPDILLPDIFVKISAAAHQRPADP